MSVSFSDSFNRANGGIGSNWTQTNGTYTITSHSVWGTGGVACPSTAVADFTGATDQWAELTIASLTTAGEFGGLTLRFTTASGGYVLDITSDGATYNIGILDGTGSWNGSLPGGSGLTLGASVGDVLHFQVIGNVLSVFKNGTILGSPLTDSSSHFSAGQPGLWADSQTSSFAFTKFSAANIITFKQASESTYSTSGVATTPVMAAITGDALVASVWWNEFTNPSSFSLSDNAGNTWTLVPNTFLSHSTTSFAVMRQQMAICLNATGNASYALTATFTGSPGFCQVAVMEFTGVATANALDLSTGTAAVGTAPSTTLGTPNESGEVIVSGFVCDGSNGNVTAGTGMTLVYSNNAGNGTWAAEYQIQTTAESASPSYSTLLSGSTYFVSALSLSAFPISAPTGGVIPSLMMTGMGL